MSGLKKLLGLKMAWMSLSFLLPYTDADLCHMISVQCQNFILKLNRNNMIVYTIRMMIDLYPFRCSLDSSQRSCTLEARFKGSASKANLSTLNQKNLQLQSFQIEINNSSYQLQTFALETQVTLFFYIRDSFFELSLGVLKFSAVFSLKFS